MYIGLTPELTELRDELRDYYAKLLTPEVEAQLSTGEGIGPVPRKIWKQMAADGWAGIGWPTEYGGQGRTAIEQFIFFDESMRVGAPVPMLTINSVAPTIMRYGSQEQKDFYLPKILKGEIHFAIGYTEPDAGTDLASLKTRADRDGDEYVINGQKVFTSLASDSDYIWLAVRTDQNVKKHKGISIIIVPTDTPGFKFEPIKNMGGLDTNVTYYEDVRVPVGNLVGGENQGWNLITNQLNHERVTLCASGVVERQLEDTIAWAAATKNADGTRVIDQEWVQINLAKVHAKLEFLKLANFKVAADATQGAPLNPAAASTIKVFGTEFYLEAFRLLMEIVGPSAPVKFGSPEAVLKGRLEARVRSMHILTFGGGTNEMQRDLIAIFGLNMPGSPR
ncbi:MAG: acyl-CoA dehydrogenase family protein [Acidimicrobiia bacterium]